MAGLAAPKDVQKQKRKKKSKSRTQVEISSSESDSDVAPKKSKNVDSNEKVVKKAVKDNATTIEESRSTKKLKKTKKVKASSKSETAPLEEDAVEKNDVAMVDAPASPVPASKSKQQPSRQEDFTSIYLKKITVELADDLDKVREANDFNNRSLPMLIHALKQGESIFSAEEKRRVVGAVNL